MILLHRLGTLIAELADKLFHKRAAARLSQLSDNDLQEFGFTRQQLSHAKLGFGYYVASLYSPRNRSGYTV